MGFRHVAVTLIADIVPVLGKEFFDINKNIERWFALKSVRDMVKLYSQMHHTEKYSQHNSII